MIDTLTLAYALRSNYRYRRPDLVFVAYPREILIVSEDPKLKRELARLVIPDQVLNGHQGKALDYVWQLAERALYPGIYAWVDRSPDQIFKFQMSEPKGVQ